jgi:hypothetical protein
LELSFDSGAGWLFPVAVAAGLITWLHYRSHSLRIGQRRLFLVLTGLRFLTLFLAGALFTGPQLRFRQNEIKKPLLLVLSDRSASMAASGDTAEIIRFLKEKLPADSEKIFGENTLRILPFGCDHTTASFSAPCTDLESAMQQAAERYSGQPIAAVIVLSDGIVNRGMHPLYAPWPFRAPLYTLGWGDTIPARDLLLKNPAAPRMAFMGNTITIEADISGVGFEGKNIPVALSEKGKQLAISNFSLSGNPPYARARFTVETDEPGMRHFTIQVPVQDKERHAGNNRAEVYVDVVDERQKVALVYQSPHPDIAAIREAFASAPAYSLDVMDAAQYLRNGNSSYDLLIWHQLPSSDRGINEAMSRQAASGANMLFVIGAQTRTGKELSAIDPSFGLQAAPGRNTEAMAAWNPGFTAFEAAPGWADALAQWPPLTVPFGNYTAGAGFEVLAWQRIGSVNTQNPLIAFSTRGQQKTGWICGEGIWRWRMRQYLRDKNHDLFDAFFMRLVQYTAIRSNRRLFTAATTRRLYASGEPVVFEAVLLDKTRNPKQGRTIELITRSAGGQTRRWTMSPGKMAYRLDAGVLPAGDYAFEAVVRESGEKDQGVFSVSDDAPELVELKADWTLLRQWAGRHGGLFATWKDRESLLQKVGERNRARDVIQSDITVRSLLDLPWYLGIILFLLCAEWVLRRRAGGY